MRTRRLPTVIVLALIASSSFIPVSQAASKADPQRAPSVGIVANFEQWLLSTVEQVEEMLGLGAPITQAPTGETDSNPPPSAQRECGASIDPNGGCTS